MTWTDESATKNEADSHRNLHSAVFQPQQIIKRSPKSVASCRRRVSLEGILPISDLLVLLVVLATTGTSSILTLAFITVTLILLRREGLQRPRLTLSVLDDLPPLMLSILAAAALLMVPVALAGRKQEIRQLAVSVVSSAVVMVLVRAALFAAVRWARRHQLTTNGRTVIVGCDSVGARLAKTCQEYPELGLTPIGFLDGSSLIEPDVDSIPVLGKIGDLAQVITAQHIRNVVIAFDRNQESNIVDTVRLCDRLGIEIFTVPRLLEIHSSSRDHETARGIPLIRLRRPAGRVPSWRLKRILDIAVSGTAIALLSPILIACAIATKVELRDRILFRQRRIGIDGRGFEILKFQTLKPHGTNDSSTTWNIAHDERMKKVGRAMRRLSLDELPQLWNILRGDMSLVGPRPERPIFVERFAAEHPEYFYRHRVPCGLTGWAQVNGLRGDTSISERARFDNYYIDNWSFWLDIKIMARTVGQVVKGAGS